MNTTESWNNLQEKLQDNCNKAHQDVELAQKAAENEDKRQAQANQLLKKWRNLNAICDEYKEGLVPIQSYSILPPFKHVSQIEEKYGSSSMFWYNVNQCKNDPVYDYLLHSNPTNVVEKTIFGKRVLKSGYAYDEKIRILKKIENRILTENEYTSVFERLGDIEELARYLHQEGFKRYQTEETLRTGKMWNPEKWDIKNSRRYGYKLDNIK
jgi:hypothetical protein